MDIERLTTTLQQSLSDAQKLARANGQQQVDVEHFLVALLEQSNQRTDDLLHGAGVDTGTELRRRCRDGIGTPAQGVRFEC